MLHRGDKVLFIFSKTTLYFVFVDDIGDAGVGFDFAINKYNWRRHFLHIVYTVNNLIRFPFCIV